MTHLDDATLARLRGDEERDEDADAFRHLASCAICRARMAEDSAEVRALTAASETKAKVIPISDRRVGGKVLVLVSGVLAAAAIIVIMVLGLRRPHESPPIALRTKSYTGTMGSSPPPSVSAAPGDMDYELSFDAPPNLTAKLIVIDAFGHALAPVRSFERAGAELKVVVAPRTFAKHEGGARAIVLAGGETSMAAATKEIDAAFARGQLAAEEIAAIAQRHTLSRGSAPLP
ncbi:MAG: hypothetical protein ACXVEE_38825 [Polyangiales bacterium]